MNEQIWMFYCDKYHISTSSLVDYRADYFRGC